MSWQPPPAYPPVMVSDFEAHMYRDYPMQNMHQQGSAQYFPNAQSFQYPGSEYYPPPMPAYYNHYNVNDSGSVSHGQYVPPGMQASSAPYEMNAPPPQPSNYPQHPHPKNPGRGGYKNSNRGRGNPHYGRGNRGGYGQNRFEHSSPQLGPYDMNDPGYTHEEEYGYGNKRHSNASSKVKKNKQSHNGNGDSNHDHGVDEVSTLPSRSKQPDQKSRGASGNSYSYDNRYPEEKMNSRHVKDRNGYSRNGTHVEEDRFYKAKTGRNFKDRSDQGGNNEEKMNSRHFKDHNGISHNGTHVEEHRFSVEKTGRNFSDRSSHGGSKTKPFTSESKEKSSNPNKNIAKENVDRKQNKYDDVRRNTRSGHEGFSSAPISFKSQSYERKSVQKKGEKLTSPGQVENQREFLTEQLSRGKYECMVCCDNVKVDAAIWGCQQCYHVFHLACVKKWVHSSMDKETKSWRCPGCQNVSENVPNQYRCFCGRRKDPKFIRGETPHSCGETCRKKRKGTCKHSCTLLCHPGPCPPCEAMLWQSCDCGNDRKHVRCSTAQAYKCEVVCDKPLNCLIHKCDQVCHAGFCSPCTVSKEQGCFCKKSSRQVICGTEEFKLEVYSCEKVCGRTLSCGNHVCEELCHPGDCAPCAFMPETLKTCCCGKTSISDVKHEARSSCLDPMPTCDKICDKPLTCGPKNFPHRCDRTCHEGECGPCKKTTQLRCQCNATEKEMQCDIAKTYDADNPYKCLRRCGKKKNCGKHKCSDNCCTKEIHICEIVCSKFLSCGVHKCEELCHRGNCKRCMETSFEELSCSCGATIIEPPVPCGTKPPECRQLCQRRHPCDHPVRHNCHSDEACPPCIELTERLCMGGHMLRKNVLCHMDNISCGYPCGKDLPCGQHKCQKTCHKGACLDVDSVCEQPCPRVRSACGHPCNSPCHTGDCPNTQCKTEMTISCPCGSRCAKVECLLGGDQSAQIVQFQRLSVLSMAESGGQGVDMAQFTQQKQSRRKLDCDTNCAILERNRRMALALEIKNPDLENKLGKANFSEYLKEFAKKNPKFAKDVEQNIYDLVTSAKQSTQASRTHSFPPMNRDQRHFVHEIAENYGCQTQSYDFEPNKNVIATAFKEKCWLPNVTLSQALIKEQQPKGPPPISSLKSQGVKFKVMEKGTLGSDASSSKGAWGGWGASKTSVPPVAPSNRGWEQTKSKSAQPKPNNTRNESAAAAIDYFDFSTN